MKTKKQIKNIVDKAVDKSFINGKLAHRRVLAFVKLFKSQSKVEAIKLLAEYTKRLRLILNSETMVVESVTPLQQKDKLELRKKFGQRFTILNEEFKINPSLLGGLKVKIGDYVFEDSITSRIKQIGEVIRG